MKTIFPQYFLLLRSLDRLYANTLVTTEYSSISKYTFQKHGPLIIQTLFIDILKFTIIDNLFFQEVKVALCQIRQIWGVTIVKICFLVKESVATIDRSDDA